MDETRLDALTPSESALLEKHSSQLRRDFHGTFIHGLDAKGRMIVPAAFRPSLGEKFNICLTPDFKAIALYSKLGWELQYCTLLEMLEKDPQIQTVINFFSKYTYDNCECDGQGRVLLPQKLRARFLQDAKDVDVSGAGSHIRITRLEDAEKEEEDFFQNYPNPLALQREIINKPRSQF